eukprot:1392052-Amorphochlora_amoeboformis.AAC.1
MRCADEVHGMTGGSLMVPLCSSDRESTIEEKPKFHQFRPHRLLVKPSNNNSYDFIYFSDAENHPKVSPVITVRMTARGRNRPD